MGPVPISWNSPKASVLIDIYFAKCVMASSGARCRQTLKHHSFSPLFFEWHWEKSVVDVLTQVYCCHMSNKTARWQTDLLHSWLPPSLLLRALRGGCTACAGNKCTNWYLAVTHKVSQISWEHTTRFLCPRSGNKNRLTSAQCYFPANSPGSHYAQK